jgi:hypothetical protein
MNSPVYLWRPRFVKRVGYKVDFPRILPWMLRKSGYQLNTFFPSDDPQMVEPKLRDKGVVSAIVGSHPKFEQLRKVKPEIVEGLKKTGATYHEIEEIMHTISRERLFQTVGDILNRWMRRRPARQIIFGEFPAEQYTVPFNEGWRGPWYVYEKVRRVIGEYVPGYDSGDGEYDPPSIKAKHITLYRVGSYLHKPQFLLPEDTMTGEEFQDLRQTSEVMSNA